MKECGITGDRTFDNAITKLRKAGKMASKPGRLDGRHRVYDLQ